MAYDSRPETWNHIGRVRELMADVVSNLMRRSDGHDRSKLVEPELSIFDKYTPMLREVEYGSDEYQRYLREMGVALAHHYEENDHHPEHDERGIAGMSLMALLEMLCDWKAAGERHADGGDVRRSIGMNQERFGYSDEMKSILLATADELGM
jgi:hypothetical protein